MVLHDLITIDPEIVSGTPVFTGTSVPIQSVFDYIAAGDALEVYLEDFPGVKKDQALRLLDLAGKEFNNQLVHKLHKDITG